MQPPLIYQFQLMTFSPADDAPGIVLSQHPSAADRRLSWVAEPGASSAYLMDFKVHGGGATLQIMREFGKRQQYIIDN